VEETSSRTKGRLVRDIKGEKELLQNEAQVEKLYAQIGL
jgi:hypothetical protein